MRFGNCSLIIIFLFCFFLLSCVPGEKKEVDLEVAIARDEMRVTVVTATIVAEYVARELSLNAKKAEKFVTDYVTERGAAVRQQAAMRQKRDPQFSQSVFRQNEKGLLRVMNSNFNPDQKARALSILRTDGRLGATYGFIDTSVSRLVQANIHKRKIEQVMPMLEKYHREFVALYAKAREEGISREKTMDRVFEHRKAIAKELAAIIGEEGAIIWLDLRRSLGSN